MNPRHKDFKHYGGRGIKVCARWDNFLHFLTDMGEKPTGMTLDRIRINEGYEPGNCKWSTQKEQTRNTRVNRLLTFKGKTQPLAAWCEEMGLVYTTAHRRLRLGWRVEAVLDQRIFTSRFDRARRMGNPK